MGVATPMAISSCGKKIQVTGVKLNDNSIFLSLNGPNSFYKLTATILPENATNKNVSWSSSDPSIVIVDQNGNVTAKSLGVATVTVTTESGKKTDTCKVTVSENIIHVTSIELDSKKIFLYPDQSYKLTATVLPEDATNKNVTWSSLKPSIAIVDQNGNVTAKSPGDVEIAVTTEDGWHTAVCEVVVWDIPVTGVTLDKDKLELDQGTTAQLKATVLPENATNKNVTWSSSDESIATVDQNGNVIAKNPGTATITVTTEDGSKTDTCEVIVTENTIHVTSVTLDKDKLELVQGKNTQLKATVLPENATNKNVTWSSSDESITTVDQNGNVTAKNPGTATIHVTTDDGGYTAYCVVTVSAKIPVTGVTLDKDKLELAQGGTGQLTAYVLPENATNKKVIWSSSDLSIASVDQNGNVTAKTVGNVTITVTTDDGGYTATCDVTVKEYIPVKSVTIDKYDLKIIEGETAQLIATILPENATNKNVTWRSNDTSVATVDQNGKVTAIGEGLAMIYVTTEDGNKEAGCFIYVTAKTPVIGVTLNETKLELVEGGAAQLTATVLPENATNKNVTWRSNDTSLVTVDQNGNVTAKNPGSGAVGLTTVTVTTEDGGYEASCTVTVWGRTPEPVVVNLDGQGIFVWGDIVVKCNLLSNNYGQREAVLLSKFNGDSENGYVDGTGILRIPDYVDWGNARYYVKRIPSEWSDGSNNIDGIEFESNVSHLREICDYAFKGTDALDNYHQKFVTFPEGLEYIGTEAFYNVDRGNENIYCGFVFPSTLNAINARAFARAGLIGPYVQQRSTLTFKNANFDPNNIKEKAFSPYGYSLVNNVHFIDAPNIELATYIANYIRVCFEDDFMISDSLLVPRVIG